MNKETIKLSIKAEEEIYMYYLIQVITLEQSKKYLRKIRQEIYLSTLNKDFEYIKIIDNKTKQFGLDIANFNTRIKYQKKKIINLKNILSSL